MSRRTKTESSPEVDWYYLNPIRKTGETLSPD